MSNRSEVGSVVVIMAKEPVAGRVKTRLSPPLSRHAAALLSQALLEDTMSMVSRVNGLRLAVAVSPPAAVQTWGTRLPGRPLLLPVEGGDIGACLAAATGQLFAAGFSRVIALNSDSPTLPVSVLEQAVVLLDFADVVVGPSDDGGYYLVGLGAPCPGLFHDIDWSSARVAAQTRARADALGCSTAWLPSWYDVDTPANLARLAQEALRLPADVLASTRHVLASIAPPSAPDAANVRSRATAHEPRNGETNR